MQAERNDTQTSGDRIAEIGELLALGLIRLLARKSRELSVPTGESSLDCFARQSGHSQPETERNDR
jgi:hypothetical protein